jgi:hypothetical protein
LPTLVPGTLVGPTQAVAQATISPRATSTPRGSQDGGLLSVRNIVILLVVLAPLALAAAWFIVRRMSAPPPE